MNVNLVNQCFNNEFACEIPRGRLGYCTTVKLHSGQCHIIPPGLVQNNSLSILLFLQDIYLEHLCKS